VFVRADEADSFLRDRRGALRSWEVTTVNEFLQQLEQHRGVVACTTDLYRDLDEASLRRFVFKVRFDYLRPEKALMMLEQTWGGPLEGGDGARAQARQALGRLRDVTPGDFAAVDRRLCALGGSFGWEDILAELEVEMRGRGSSAGPVGLSRDGYFRLRSSAPDFRYEWCQSRACST
jgi:hypothetical protein